MEHAHFIFIHGVNYAGVPCTFGELERMIHYVIPNCLVNTIEVYFKVCYYYTDLN